MGDFLEQTYYGSTVTEWLVALLIIMGSALGGRLVYWIFKNLIGKLTAKTKTKLDDILVDMIEEPVFFGIILAGIWYAFSRLNFTESVDLWLGHAMRFVITLNVAWFITRLFDALFQEYLVPLAEKSKSDLDDQLLPIARRGTKIVVWSLAVIIALNNAGYDVGAALAGLGIGGLALAMAAKDTVANIFGGFTVFTDQPFKLKDRIKIDGYDGNVQEIGIRSTKLVTLAGRLVTIPNSTFSDTPVENLSAEPSRKIALDIGLTYDMSPEQMKEAMDTLKAIAEKHESTEEKVLVGFNGFGDFSMNILFIYYITKGEDILGTQTEINLAILEQFNEKGLEMAFPTQTIVTQSA